MTPIDSIPSSEMNSPSEIPPPRQGWEAQYQKMSENNDDALLDGDWSLTEWDDAEWDW